jgi:ribonuclease P protein component
METLKTNGDFDRTRRNGRTWATGLVVLNAARNDSASNRFGFIAGKKVGNAVARNRARRLMREAVRLRLSLIKPGWDLVWIARAGIVDKKLDAVMASVDDLLRRARLYTGDKVAETAGAQSRIMEREQSSSGDAREASLVQNPQSAIVTPK